MMITSSPKISTVILVTSNGMGRTDQELQHKLIKNYLRLIGEADFHSPDAICFYADGVKLVTEGSSVLDELKALTEKEVLLIICSTCLNYFNLMDKVQIGIPGTMVDIIELQQQAEKVITI